MGLDIEANVIIGIELDSHDSVPADCPYKIAMLGCEHECSEIIHICRYCEKECDDLCECYIDCRCTCETCDELVFDCECDCDCVDEEDCIKCNPECKGTCSAVCKKCKLLHYECECDNCNCRYTEYECEHENPLFKVLIISRIFMDVSPGSHEPFCTRLLDLSYVNEYYPNKEIKIFSWGN